MCAAVRLQPQLMEGGGGGGVQRFQNARRCKRLEVTFSARGGRFLDAKMRRLGEWLFALAPNVLQIAPTSTAACRRQRVESIAAKTLRQDGRAEEFFAHKTCVRLRFASIDVSIFVPSPKNPSESPEEQNERP